MSATSTLENVSFAASTTPDVQLHARQGISKKALWTGRTLTGLVSLFLSFDAAIKLLKLDMVRQSSLELGYPPETMLPIGLTLLACLILHWIPRTAVLGAVLLTGHLGGAIATHVRVGNPLASHVLFPIYVAALLWGGLYLRDTRVPALLARRDAR